MGKPLPRQLGMHKTDEIPIVAFMKGNVTTFFIENLF